MREPARVDVEDMVRVTCNACHAVHDIAPPPWVVASGRPFGMQCARCGARQDVHPIGLQMLDDGTSGAYPGLGRVRVDGEPVEPAVAVVSERVNGATLVADVVPEAEESLSMPVPFGRGAGSDGGSAVGVSSSRRLSGGAPDPHAVTLSDADDADPSPVAPSGAALLAGLQHDMSVGADPAELLDATAPAVRAAPAPAAAPDPRADPPRGAGDFVLLQDGELFDVADLATVQRWVMERRVEPDDRLSYQASAWVRAGDMDSLTVFFAAVAALAAHGDGPADAAAAPDVAGRPPRRPWSGLTGLGPPERTEESEVVPAVNVGLDHLDAPPVPEHLLGRAPVAPIVEAPPPDSATVYMPAAPVLVGMVGPAAGKPVAASAAERSFGVDDDEDDHRAAAPGAASADGIGWGFGVFLLVVAAVLAVWFANSGGDPGASPPGLADGAAPVAAPAVEAPVVPADAASPSSAPAVTAAAPPSPSMAPSAAPAVAASASQRSSDAAPSRAPAPAATLTSPRRPAAAPVDPGPSPWGAAPVAAPAPPPWEAPPAPAAAEPDDWEPPPPPPPPAATATTASLGSLIDSGWGALDQGDAAAAAAFFEQAATLSPGSVDANYGLGYAYVKQGRNLDAQVRLCKARARAGDTDRREIDAVLQGAGLGCE